MRRWILLATWCLQLVSVSAAFARGADSVVIRPSGARSPAASVAMTAANVKRARVAKALKFATDEIRVRLPGSMVGKAVYVSQGKDVHARPASSLFEAFQAVEAAHSGHAAEVHVVLDAATRDQYGEAFLAQMFRGLDARSLAFAGTKGERSEVSLVDLPEQRPSASVETLKKAPLAVWTGSSHPELGNALAKKLHVEEIQAERRDDGRLLPSPLPAQVAGKRIVLVQTKRMGDSERFHLDLLEMLHRAYEAKRDGAASVMVASPYLPYSRSDRMDTPGTTVGAAILPQLMKRAGVDQVLFYSVHQAQEVGIFQALHIKTAHAAGELVLAQSIAAHVTEMGIPLPTLRVLAPDAGAAKRALVFAKHLEQLLGMPHESLAKTIVIADKQRSGEKGELVKVNFKGEVEGMTIIAVDDETATGTTLDENATAARASGAKSVIGAVAHLTGAAQKKLTGSAVDRLFVLDTLPQAEVRASTGHPVEVVPIADHLAQLVRGLNNGTNVDNLLFFEH